MATTTNFATAASGTSWTTPTNANADDAAYATYTIAAKNTTGNVNSLSSFGFDAAIPAGATINSVTLEVQHKVSTAGGIAFLESALAIGATVGTYNSDGSEPTADTIATYSAMARPGGGTWTRNDLLDATFTVKLRARSGNNATSVVYSWDYATVTVDYTPQDFPLTANAGAYTLTGQAATIARNSALTATAGSYTLSGVNATLTYVAAVTGFELTALAGSYGLTGQAATVSRDKLLTASTGSYTLTGVNADLTKSKLITASAGSYTVNGQSADLSYVAPGAYVITAGAGSYALTGQAAVIAFGAVEPDPVAVEQGGSYAPMRQHFGPRRDALNQIKAAEVGQVIEPTIEPEAIQEPQINRIKSLFADRYPQFDYAINQELVESLRLEMQQQDDEYQAVAIVMAMLL